MTKKAVGGIGVLLIVLPALGFGFYIAGWAGLLAGLGVVSVLAGAGLISVAIEDEDLPSYYD